MFMYAQYASRGIVSLREVNPGQWLGSVIPLDLMCASRACLNNDRFEKQSNDFGRLFHTKHTYTEKK